MAGDPYKYFRLEARELLDKLQAGVLELDRTGSADVVKQLLRIAHTLKGAARAVRQPEIADHAHAMEDALAPYRDAGGTPHATIEAILARLDDMEHRVRALGQPAGAASQAAPEPGPTDTLHSLRAEIGDMDVVLDGIAETHAGIVGLRRTRDALEEAQHVAELLADQLAPRAARRPSERAHTTAEQLHRTLGSIDRNLGTAIDQLDRELRQVRDAVEQLRLVPASAMFTTLERSARDAAQVQGKAVVFEGKGGDVRLDAHVLAVLQPALLQLIRNAVAHGIEPEIERKRGGKPGPGRVAVEVERRGRRVTFRCRDDGRGIDVDAVRRIAARRGIAWPATQVPALDELVQLLLRGGITTAAAVTEVAGRGVGLDVVREVADRLAGTVTVSTEPRVGTTFELVVPVSLASLEALVVESAGVVAAIPLDAVRRTLRVAAADVATTPSGAAIAHDGKIIPFVPLDLVLRRRGPAGSRAWSAVVVEDRGRLAAVGVDRLLGTSTVVVRPLPELGPADPVIAGASFNADGNPQLVLDPDRLVDARPVRALAIDRPRVRILVVDDSLTTRMLEQSILESAGYEVDLAVSAEEGLERARATRYALFLVDVEMPGMDGFAFIERTRRDPELRDIPAILVTSRASVEDRARGREVGAHGYVVKGEFDQVALLEQIAGLVA
jgi:two-component system, chemotaxis family, sensor kinase CheA